MASKQQQPLFWTSADRDAFVQKALSSEDKRGCSSPFWFNVLPKVSCPDNEDARRGAATKALMNVIFGTPEYRILALKVYDILLQKIASHPETSRMYLKHIVVVLKGGTAYTYVVSDRPDVFPFSDLDIVVAIDPSLPPPVFERVKAVVDTIVLQTISQYKRMLDHMLFLNKPINDQVLSPDAIRRFKQDFMAAFETLSDESGAFLSPVSATDVRNGVSRHSFILSDSIVQPGSVVRVEVPHFERCECIPLRKTPVICSHNRSIRFNRTPGAASEAVGHFDLYRIRMNFMFLKQDDGECSTTSASSSNSSDKAYDCLAADFIDISVLAQDDAELHDFWRHGVLTSVYDRSVRMWITIPDVPTMLDDLHKMLHVYECPEAKRERREVRHRVLSEYAISGMLKK